ncbi:hypothetical protein [Streptomyces sp. GbtcB6]|uniref:hypothetical protein n=1 Tax=Streptomyces sp. GbtcB6 TaxID=2824751 RepID=UPI001C2F7E1D|nr:hypothetical protein [Streptomyces sp. GbtcB6]
MTTAQWLAAAGIGTGTGTVLLVLLKVALDEGPLTDYWATRKAPAEPSPALPSRAPSRRRHAAPAVPQHTETLPLRVQELRARHSKDAA